MRWSVVGGSDGRRRGGGRAEGGRRREEVELDLRVRMDLFDEEKAQKRERVRSESTKRAEEQIGVLRRKGVGR